MSGDFNFVLKFVDVDTQRRCPQLADFVKAKNLDAFRFLHPDTKEDTLFRANAAPSRLDRFYLTCDFF